MKNTCSELNFYFDVLFDRVLDLLNKYDIEKLIACGAPIDEYLPEAKLIYVTLKCNYSKDELTKKVMNIWFDMFGSTKYNFEPLINDLLKIQKEMIG